MLGVFLRLRVVEGSDNTSSGCPSEPEICTCSYAKLRFVEEERLEPERA